MQNFAAAAKITNCLMQTWNYYNLQCSLMNSSLTSITLSLGLIFFVVGLLLKILPPKRMNSIYGYRTSSSMRNLDTWTAANNYSAKLMIFEGISLTVIGLISPAIPDMGIIGTGIAIGFLIFSVIVLIIATEKYLNKIFDKNGNRRIT
jgi:uncharacterized membrane protein